MVTGTVNIASRYCGAPARGTVAAYGSGVAWLAASLYLMQAVATAFAARRLSAATALMLLALWFGVPWLGVRFLLPPSCIAAHQR